jgi:peptide/nickel transport system substrate-binding protein
MNIRTLLKMTGSALTLIMVVSMLAACAKPEAEVVEVEVTRVVAGTPETVIITTTPEPKPEPTEEPAVEAPDTLVMVTAMSLPGLDPDIYTGGNWLRAVSNVFEGVLDYEKVPEAQLSIPIGIDLAGVANISGQGDEGIIGNFFESWEISEDGKTMIMHVREGYKSWRGHQATAEDFIWRVERAFALKDMGEFQVMISGISGPECVRKIDDMTVEVSTPKGENPIFFKALTVMVVTAIDVDALREDGCITDDDPWAKECFKKKDYGFGAYHIVEHTPGVQYVFEANPYYHQPTYFKRVILREVPEAGNRLAMLISGEAHVSQELSLLQMDELRGGKDEARLVYLPMANTWGHIMFNRETGPFVNDQCFQAVGYAIPYEEIQRTAYLGFGQLEHNVVCRMYGETVNLDYQPYRHDLDKAEELWKAGNCPDSWTLSWARAFEHFEEIAVLIRTEFARIGVDVVLDKQPAAALHDKVRAGNFDGHLQEARAFVADAGYKGWLNWHKDSFGNEQRFYDDEISAMIDQAMFLPAGPERNQLLWDLQVELIDRGGRITILWPGWRVGANKHLKGFNWYPDTYLRWKELYWEE